MVDYHNKITMQQLVVTLRDFRCVKSHDDGSDREQLISVAVMSPPPHPLPPPPKKAQPANRQCSITVGM